MMKRNGKPKQTIRLCFSGWSKVETSCSNGVVVVVVLPCVLKFCCIISGYENYAQDFVSLSLL